MNFIDYCKVGEGIVNALRNCDKKIVLYGTGSIGNYIGCLLKDVVSGYCVSKKNEEIAFFNEMPVYQIGDIPYATEKCKIILTLDSRHWESVTEELIKHGYCDIVCASIEFQNALLSKFYKELFVRLNIDLEQNLMLINGVKIRNPLKVNEADFKAILIEMNDLVIGDILKDYSLWSEGPYLYKNVDLVAGDIVLDCGANLGLFSCIAASKNCISYAFEPTKRLCDDLEICSEAYNGAIIPCNLALSNQNGFADLAISEEWDVANTIVADINNTIIQKDGYKNYSKVKTITVDEFIEVNQIDKIDFIKADIEGAERFMLEGATKTLAKFAPKLSICTYHFKDDPEVLEGIVKRANPEYIIEHRWKKMYAYVEKR